MIDQDIGTGERSTKMDRTKYLPRYNLFKGFSFYFPAYKTRLYIYKG